MPKKLVITRTYYNTENKVCSLFFFLLACFSSVVWSGFEDGHVFDSIYFFFVSSELCYKAFKRTEIVRDPRVIKAYLQANRKGKNHVDLQGRQLVVRVAKKPERTDSGDVTLILVSSPHTPFFHQGDAQSSQLQLRQKRKRLQEKLARLRKLEETGPNNVKVHFALVAGLCVSEPRIFLNNATFTLLFMLCEEQQDEVWRVRGRRPHAHQLWLPVVLGAARAR